MLNDQESGSLRAVGDVSVPYRQCGGVSAVPFGTLYTVVKRTCAYKRYSGPQSRPRLGPPANRLERTQSFVSLQIEESHGNHENNFGWQR